MDQSPKQQPFSLKSLSQAGVHAKLYFEMRSDLSLLQKANLSVPFSGPIIGSRKLLQSWVTMVMKVEDVEYEIS